MQQTWGAADANCEERPKEGFLKGEKMDLRDFRMCFTVLRGELQFEIEIRTGKSFTHRRFNKLK